MLIQFPRQRASVEVRRETVFSTDGTLFFVCPQLPTEGPLEQDSSFPSFFVLACCNLLVFFPREKEVN